jgi:hypothetical protein
MASTSQTTAGESQEFSKSVEGNEEGLQSPILEDGLNAKGIGGEYWTQVAAVI